MDSEKTVIVIRSLIPGGVAQTDGRLVPGDKLLAVNDINVEHATLDEAVRVLKSVPKGIVKLAVAKPLSTNESGSYTSQVSIFAFLNGHCEKWIDSGKCSARILEFLI